MISEPIHIEITSDGTVTYSTVEKFLENNDPIDQADIDQLNALKIGDAHTIASFVGCTCVVKRIPAPLPALATLYADDSLQTLTDASAFQVLVNQPPKKEWCKIHPFIKDKNAEGKDVPYLYIPIERIEWLLTNVVVQYRIEVKTIQQIANSICVSVRLHYFNPVAGEWTYHDGIGAAPLQTNKDAGAIDWNQIKSNAVQIGAPAAKTYAVKDAAEQIGKLFGKDLNRREVIAYDYQKMVVDKFAKALADD